MLAGSTLSQVLAGWFSFGLFFSAFASPATEIFDECGVSAEVTTHSSFIGHNASERLTTTSKVARLRVFSEFRLSEQNAILDSQSVTDNISEVNAPLLRAVSSSSGVEIWLFDFDGGHRVEENAFRLACAALERALNFSCASGKVHRGESVQIDTANGNSGPSDYNGSGLTGGQSLERVLPGTGLQFQHLFVSFEALAETGFNFLGRRGSSVQGRTEVFREAESKLTWDGGGGGGGGNSGTGLLRSFHMAVTVDIAGGTVRAQKSLDSVELAAAAQRENAAGLNVSSSVPSGLCASLNLTWLEDEDEDDEASPVRLRTSLPSRRPDGSSLSGEGVSSNVVSSFSMARRLAGRGFHRHLHSSIEIAAPSAGAAVACQAKAAEQEAPLKLLRLAILELVGTGFYIDLDEARNLARHGGPAVRGVSEYIDIERPQYRSRGSVVALEALLSPGQSATTLSARVQCPIHFRYHRPISAKESRQSNREEGGSASNFRDLTIPAPLLFWTCAPANAHPSSEWKWLPIAPDAVKVGGFEAAGPAAPDPLNFAGGSSLFGNAVPVGSDDDYAVVMVGTLVVLASSAAAVLWAAFSFDSDSASVKKRV